ncbi:hypothetical protein, partial [Pseudaminobacter soli (ex Li et al. 2025)]
INLAQLRDDLFGLVLLLGHSNVLSNGSRAYFREDHFSGGRPSGDIASFTRDPIWAELSEHIGAGAITPTSDEWQWSGF